MEGAHTISSRPRWRISYLFPIIRVSTFQVFVANGASIECTAKCVGLPITIQGHEFTVDFYVLDLKGADIVLGVQWMMGLGIIRTNYHHLTMAFEWKGEQVTIQGERLLKPGGINYRALQKMVTDDVVASFFHLRIVEDVEQTITEEVHSEEVQ